MIFWYSHDIPVITYYQWEFQDPNMEILYHIYGLYKGYVAH
jgi:hypothetical protein